MTRLASFRRNDEGVTEIIGYVLSFALSAVFLLIALNVFYAARGNTDDVVTGVELKSIADRIAARVVEAGLVSQEFPNATMNTTLNIPQALNDRPYSVWVVGGVIAVGTDDGELNATATTFKLESLPGLTVSGYARSSNERIIISYLGEANQITIRGG